MFRTNNNQDRVSYSTALLPPDGYTLEKAVGTTCSLDLEALTAVLIALGLKEEPDSDLLQNPVSMLNALVKASEKVLIFCEAGQIKTPSKSSALMLLLDKMVVPVALPNASGKGRYPSFHPKTWILQYCNPEGKRKYRFVVLSRNLTFDRSWDVSVCIESADDKGHSEKTEPIRGFLRFLQTHVSTTVSDCQQKNQMIGDLISELDSVPFSLDDKKFGDNFTVMPLGIGPESYDLTKDPIYYQLPWRADYSFSELVVFSPFLSSSIIEYWNKPEHSLTGTKRTLITRKSELPKLSEAQVSRFRIFALKDDIVNREDNISYDYDAADQEKEDIRKSDTQKPDIQKQDIHAKIYIRRKYQNTDLYIGSMNASYAAMHENVEMMIRIGTTSRYYDGERFLREIFCGEADGPDNPFEEVQVASKAQMVEGEEAKYLEQVIKELCRTPKRAEVIQAGEKYSIRVNIEQGLKDKDAEIMLAPLRRDTFVPIAEEVLFPELDVLQLTDFYQVKVKRNNAELTRIIMIPTTGLPEERESAVVNSVIKDKRTFVEYIAFILGDDYLLTLLEESILGTSGFYGDQTDRLPALYEKMLKTALEDPSRLKEIEYVLKMIHDSSIVPDEFRDLYATFKETLGLR